MPKVRRDIVVIGAGRFGQAVSNQLGELKINALVIDKNQEALQMLPKGVKSYVGDAANIDLLKDLAIHKFETVIVAISENIEIIGALIEAGVENIIAKATSLRHHRVLKAIGVDVIIRPEYDAGIKAALTATNLNFVKYSSSLQDVGDGYAIGSTGIKSELWFNKPIMELPFNKFKTSVVSIKRNKKVSIPTGDFVLKKDDEVTLIGKVTDITKIIGELNNGGETKEIEVNNGKKLMKK